MEQKYSESCKVGSWYTDDPLVMERMKELGLDLGPSRILDFDSEYRVGGAEDELFQAVRAARAAQAPASVLKPLLDAWATLAALGLARGGEDRGE